MTTAKSTSILLIALSLFPSCGRSDCLEAPCPWPAEKLSSAINLSDLSGEDFYNDLSGASYDTNQDLLWVCRNGPEDDSRTWKLVPSGDSFSVQEEDSQVSEWSGFGDLEGLTYDPSDPWAIYGIVEGQEQVKHWQLVQGSTSPTLAGTWDLSTYLPLSEDLGAEGIAFVSDEALATAGFTTPSGELYTSRSGQGGLMFVGHQNGGGVYVFDLNVDGESFEHVGTYQTGLDETAALEFDANTGLLYIWHGADHRTLEIVALNSSGSTTDRRFEQRAMYYAPDLDANFEGLAVDSSRCPNGDTHLFLTQDDGLEKALLWFQAFPCQ